MDMYSPRQASRLIGFTIFGVFLLVALYQTGIFIAQAPARGANILMALVLGVALTALIAASSVRYGFHLARSSAVSVLTLVTVPVVYILVTAAMASIPIKTHAVVIPMDQPYTNGNALLWLAVGIGAFNLLVLPAAIAYVVVKTFGDAKRVA
jgi:hypothetical protein